MKLDVVEIYVDTAGEWRWRRRNGYNNQIVSVSGEGYKNKSHVEHMAKSVNVDVTEFKYLDRE